VFCGLQVLICLDRRAGVGLATEDVQTLTNRVIRKHEDKQIGRVDASTVTAFERWTQTEVLIVDESEQSSRIRLFTFTDRQIEGLIVSMVDGRLWDKLEAVARKIRQNTKPFGGIQLVLCGDFFQLPPVPDRYTRTSVFAFEAQSWPQCVTRIIKLKQVFRQRDQSRSRSQLLASYRMVV
jgi:hypothetical protein